MKTSFCLCLCLLGKSKNTSLISVRYEIVTCRSVNLGMNPLLTLLTTVLHSGGSRDHGALAEPRLRAPPIRVPLPRFYLVTYAQTSGACQIVTRKIDLVQAAAARSLLIILPTYRQFCSTLPMRHTPQWTLMTFSPKSQSIPRHERRAICRN